MLNIVLAKESKHNVYVFVKIIFHFLRISNMQRLPFDQELRQLKKILKQYEQEFFTFHRRKPQKSDWTGCRKAQYKRYDLLKEKLIKNTEMTELEKYEYIPKLEFTSLNQMPKRIVEKIKPTSIISTPKKQCEFNLEVEVSPSCLTPTKMDSAIILTPNKAKNNEFIPLYSTEKPLPQFIEYSPVPTTPKRKLTPRKMKSDPFPQIDWDTFTTPTKSNNITIEIPDEFISTPLKEKLLEDENKICLQLYSDGILIFI